MKIFNTTVFALLGLTCLFTTASYAQDVKITQELSFTTTRHDGKFVKIERIQNQDNHLKGGFTKTSRKCPPFCVQPMQVAPGVATIGELELINFIDDKLNRSAGVVVDARTPAWHEKGTIPGSINIPFNTFNDDQPEEAKTAAFAKLGVYRKKDSSFVGGMWDSIKGIADEKSAASPWSFSRAREVVLWCNGMWCGQSPAAIKKLLDMGYPEDKIYYYRGGMQSWKMLGLTVVSPERVEMSMQR